MRFIVRPTRNGRKPEACEYPASQRIASRLSDYLALLGNLVTHSRDFH